jgi:DNA-directed RNA polymerase subunit alpha
MEAISLPTKIELKPQGKGNIGILTVEPLHRGYGVTLGNSLRRVLLSSLPGAAVTSVKIKGVQHEFSTVPNVKEDVLEILLNLKMLRCKVFSDEPVKLFLKVKGEKEVTVDDIERDANVEIVNPELIIAHLTDKNAVLEMEVVVEKGFGYAPTEERKKENLEIGAIAVDAVFGPIKNVAMKVEDTRVGQDINFDKLTLEIETDGTMSPAQALTESAKLLIDHFALFTNFVAEEAPEVSKKEKVSKVKKQAKEEETEKKEKEEAPKKKRGRAKKG